MTLTEQQHNIRVAIGLRIKERRTKLGVTQRLLCDRIGMSFSKFRQVEHGESPINTDQLCAIAHYLDTPIGYFLEVTSAEVKVATDSTDHHAVVGTCADMVPADIHKSITALMKALVGAARREAAINKNTRG